MPPELSRVVSLQHLAPCQWAHGERLISTSCMGAVHLAREQNAKDLFCQIPAHAELIVLGGAFREGMVTVSWRGNSYDVFTVDAELKALRKGEDALTQAA